MRLARDDLRNVAIIAHVDHGKTTLVDAMLKQSGILRDPTALAERALDTNELERERGITILAKTTSVPYGDLTVNIVDTPGHADFGGEVERILSMVDGALLVVDALEGPMPQTRYVLAKALAAGLKPVVVLNKMDRPGARPTEVADQVLELFMELTADERLWDFPLLYASAKAGVAAERPDLPRDGTLAPLFEAIRRHIPPPTGDPDGPLQMMVTTLDHDDYVGRLAIGRVSRGRLTPGQAVAVIGRDGTLRRGRVSKLYGRLGLRRVELASVAVGDIVSVAGLEQVGIGETVADADRPEALPPITVDEPTLTILIGVNRSPFGGQDGEYVTSRHLRERLLREGERNVGLRVEETDDPEVFKVSGRGELHLAILLETMRREGYEMEVGKPEVIFHETADGEREEPWEQLVLDLPEDALGPVMEQLGPRRAEMVSMTPDGSGHVRLEFLIPARGLLGFRSRYLTETRGYGTLHHVFVGYRPYAGPIPDDPRGALVALETGVATAYALDNAQLRGVLFIEPGTPVYAGMVVGENSRPQDLELNVCKKKHVTNVRNANSEEAIRLQPARQLTLDAALEYLRADELLEITPKALRIRKATLDRHQRKRERKLG
jgi:GTP-binding protein